MSDDLHDARKQLETILGGSLGDRTVPGTVDVPGREFRYIGCEPELSEKELGRLFHRVLGASPIIPGEGGGVLTENCTLTLPSGDCFFGISYKGDIEGWRNKAEQGARALKLKVARIGDEKLIIDDGREVSLSDCVVRFF